MAKCDGCGREFDDIVQLYPRLIVTKEAQVAKKLAESNGKDMLCLQCWLQTIDSVEPKDLAMLLLSLLDKLNRVVRENNELKARVYPQYPDVGSPGSCKPYQPWTVTDIYPKITWTDNTITVSPTHSSPGDNVVYCSAHVAGAWSDLLEK
jgi:hypothetical protein